MKQIVYALINTTGGTCESSCLLCSMLAPCPHNMFVHHHQACNYGEALSWVQSSSPRCIVQFHSKSAVPAQHVLSAPAQPMQHQCLTAIRLVLLARYNQCLKHHNSLACAYNNVCVLCMANTTTTMAFFAGFSWIVHICCNFVPGKHQLGGRRPRSTAQTGARHQQPGRDTAAAGQGKGKSAF